MSSKESLSGERDGTYSDFSFSAAAILSWYVTPPPLLYSSPQFRLQFFADISSDFTLSSLTCRKRTKTRLEITSPDL